MVCAACKCCVCMFFKTATSQEATNIIKALPLPLLYTEGPDAFYPIIWPSSGPAWCRHPARVYLHLHIQINTVLCMSHVFLFAVRRPQVEERLQCFTSSFALHSCILVGRLYIQLLCDVTEAEREGWGVKLLQCMLMNMNSLIGKIKQPPYMSAQ